MEKTKVIWLDVNLHTWEHDWLLDLFSGCDTELTITNTFENLPEPENCLVVCNHAIDYRYYLDCLKEKGSKYGVVLLSDENLRELMEYVHDPHCKFVARNYFHPFYATHPKVFTFGLGYKKGLQCSPQTTPAYVEREYKWCFAGTIHDDERKSATELFKNKLNPYKTHFCSGFNAEDGMGTDDYKKMLQKSKYALCPRGQVNNDSFRIYEALETGAIPVALKHAPHMKVDPSYWHAIFLGDSELPFICTETWEEALEEIEKIEKENKGAEVQEKCFTFWIKWKTNWRNEFKRRIALLA